MKKLTQNQEIKRLNREEGYVEFLAEQCVVENAREVRIHTVAGMCDNKHLMTLKKNIDGDFKLSTHIQAYSNFGIPHDKYELEWEADKGNFAAVFKMINSGFQVVEQVKSRA